MSCKYYFASMNSCNGFVNYFDRIFDSNTLERIYIIKGGAGSGKSSLIKKTAKHFDKIGHDVECFLCSSDIDSLDGVIIDKRIAVVDGTSPHAKDPSYAGVVEKIINLCDVLNEEDLTCKKSEIISNTINKQMSYKRAYGLLSAYGQLKNEIFETVIENFNYEKMSKSIERYIKQNHIKGSGFLQSVRLISAINSDGAVFLDTFETMSDKIVCITNAHNCQGVFFDEFLKQAKTNGIKTVISYDPVFCKKINALYFPEFKTCVVLSNGKENTYDEKYKVMNLERFINRSVLSENRVKLKFSEKCAKGILQAAVEELLCAKKYHEALERAYHSCVDFSRVEKIGTSLTHEIYNKLQQ